MRPAISSIIISQRRSGPSRRSGISSPRVRGTPTSSPHPASAPGTINWCSTTTSRSFPTSTTASIPTPPTSTSSSCLRPTIEPQRLITSKQKPWGAVLCRKSTVPCIGLPWMCELAVPCCAATPFFTPVWFTIIVIPL